MPYWFLLSPEEIYNKKKANEGDAGFNKNVILRSGNIAHLRALRLSASDEIVLTDGKGRAFSARLKSAGPRTADAEILYELEQKVEPSLEAFLFAGVSKRDKMEQIVRQSVELGVRRIIPVLTERTVFRVTGEDKAGKKAGRWQNVAVSAALQCRRSIVPEVLPPLNFMESLELMRESDIIIIPWEEEKSCSFRDLVQNIKKPSAVSIFTGPEGGISLNEMEKLKALPNAFAITLGPRILRAETAPLAVLSIIMYLWGDLSGEG